MLVCVHLLFIFRFRYNNLENKDTFRRILSIFLMKVMEMVFHASDAPQSTVAFFFKDEIVIVIYQTYLLRIFLLEKY